MKNIVNLLFEARILKEIQRSGYSFLGVGKESIAEHSFMTAFIALMMSQMEPEIDGMKLISMCLLHDLHEARTGDLNYVNKQYAKIDEKKATTDAFADVTFGEKMKNLVSEFEEAKTKEAKLAKDADQLSFILELKSLSDIGATPPQKWLPYVTDRLKTKTGKKIAEEIMTTGWDEWWLKDYKE